MSNNGQNFIDFREYFRKFHFLSGNVEKEIREKEIDFGDEVPKIRLQ